MYVSNKNLFLVLLSKTFHIVLVYSRSWLKL